jgi:hypothetical protein
MVYFTICREDRQYGHRLVRAQRQALSSHPRATLVHFVLWASMRETVVADDYRVTLLPFHGEPEVVGEFGPELPLIPGDVRVVSVGHLDGTVFGSESADTRPGIEPREMVSDVGVRDVHVILWEVLEGRGVILGLHEPGVTRKVCSPLDLKSTLFSESLGFLRAVSAETLLPMVPDLLLLVRIVGAFSVS